ncbi:MULTISPECIES: hypothetical protein [Prevotellaceae]|uniref:hypothetical protein n=1 Tax=Prevotellaceae TaxID=171552 RepID=UPI0003D2B5CE|nr:hypothetical protein [Prevotella phocaeensis]ETD18594.1 hypothetical protein HMPREF1199_01412 [Hoylesella oralis CC98A]
MKTTTKEIIQRLCLVLFILLLAAPAWSKEYTTTARNRNLREVEGTRTFDHGILTVTWSDCKTGPALIPANRNWEMAKGSTVTITCKEGWRVRAFYVRKQLKNAEYLRCTSNIFYDGDAGKARIKCYDAPDQSITITAEEDVEFSEYTIEYVQVRSFSAKKDSYTIYVDQEIDTPLDQMVNNPTGSPISWSIGNGKVAEIQNGKVKGKGAGQTTIVAMLKANNDYAYSEAKIKIAVLRYDIHPTLDKTDITMEAWDRPQLPKVNGMPNDYDGQIKYESSDRSVVEIDGGRLKFGGSGYGRSATITVTIPQNRKYNGATLKFTVSVNKMRIASKEDWKEFCDLVNNGLTDLNARLTQDVDLETDITMAGTVDNPYYGTFDGQGYALKMKWDGGREGNIAPFHYVKEATICNLRTQGEIKSNGRALSGLVYSADGTITISRCVSEVNLTGGYGGNASQAAGMIQIVGDDGEVTLTDCVVKGTFTDLADKDWRAMAGFVCLQQGTCTLTNCLYLGTNNADAGYTFVNDEQSSNTTLKNCYYLNACGTAQGTQVTADQLRSGEVAHNLQNKRAGNVWGQLIGTDNNPLPTSDDAKHVNKVDFTLGGWVRATRYANNGKTVSLPTARELLGSDYNAQRTYTLAFDGNFSASTPINADRTVAVTVTVPTGINGVTNDSADVNSPVYNLRGQRVADRFDAATRSQLPAGVYIVGGRKVIVK